MTARSVLTIIVILVVIVAGWLWWRSYTLDALSLHPTPESSYPTTTDDLPSTSSTHAQDATSSAADDISVRSWELYESTAGQYQILYPPDVSPQTTGDMTSFALHRDEATGTIAIRTKELGAQEDFQAYVTQIFDAAGAAGEQILKPVTISDIRGMVVISFAVGTQRTATNYLIFPRGEAGFVEVTYTVARTEDALARILTKMIETIQVDGVISVDELNMGEAGNTTTAQ